MTILVSCFYLIKPKPGRSHEKYKAYFKNMLECLSCKMLIFTNQKSKDYLDIVHPLVEYIILPLEELYFYKNYGLEFWKDQEKKDPNKTRCWQLCLLYNEKCMFVDRAIKLNPDEKWFVWCDIGCFRKKESLKFPIIDKLPNNKITLLQLEKFKKHEFKKDFFFHTEKQIRLGGGIQAATKEIWNKWIYLYKDMFDIYVKNSTVNCDQGLLASISLRNVDMVDLVWAKKTKLTKDRWFYLIEYLSDKH